MKMTEYKAVPTRCPFVDSLLIHFFPRLNQFMLNPTTDMELERTVFVIALDCVSILGFDFAKMTEQPFSTLVNLSFNVPLGFIHEPNFRDIINASQVRPTNIGFDDNSVTVIASETLHFLRLLICDVDILAPITIKVLIA